jgi:uncharacterized protein (TIGR02246 family)
MVMTSLPPILLETTPMSCRAIAIVLFLVAACILRPCQAAEEADAAAIRQASQQYVAAVNRGDAESVAAFWTPNGDLIDTQGRCTKARELVRNLQPRQNPAAPGLTLTIDTLRLITPDVAIEDGRTEHFAAAGDSLLVRHTAVWVRHGGKWLLDSVRESAADPNSHEARLQALSWLVGDWVSAGEGPAIEMSCQWSLDRHFLLREVRTQSPAGPLTVSQRIGWDPASGQVKSWTFDSQGGNGTGVWSRDGGRWTVSASGVLPDGRRATSRNSYSLEGPEALVWEAVESTIEGAPGPIHKVRLVRKTSK